MIQKEKSYKLSERRKNTLDIIHNIWIHNRLGLNKQH